MLVIKAVSFPGLKNLHKINMRSNRTSRVPRKKNKADKGCISRFDITIYTKYEEFTRFIKLY